MYTKNFLYHMAIFTIFLGFCGIGLITYWLIKPYDILTFSEGNGKLLNTTVVSGGYLRIQRNFCKNMPTMAQVSRQFIDSLKYNAHVENSNEPIGCRQDILYIYVPKALPPGKYYVKDTYVYAPNPIRKIVYTLETQSFDILPKE